MDMLLGFLWVISYTCIQFIQLCSSDHHYNILILVVQKRRTLSPLEQMRLSKLRAQMKKSLLLRQRSRLSTQEPPLPQSPNLVICQFTSLNPCLVDPGLWTLELLTTLLLILPFLKLISSRTPHFITLANGYKVKATGNSQISPLLFLTLVSILLVPYCPFNLCWVPLKYHSCKSDISSRYLQQMVAQESSPINFTMTAYDYVTALCPGGSSNNLPKGPSKRYLLSLPVEERLKKILESRPLHCFSAIKHFAPEYSEEELLGFLQQHAILVWGLWTAKSSLLYPHGGVETLARDHALLLFSKNLKVQSSDVNVRGELGTHVKNCLKIFGLERYDLIKSTGQSIPHWKFREIPDESFKKLYPNIVEKQEELFKGLEKQLSGFTSNIGKKLVKM
ncbi:hypothetical protein CR513_32064, partial [Mucuna pruriens]